jgi:DNA polymerase-3 subunit beta
MKFACNGMILSDAALTVSKACANKTIMPVLECIKLSAKNDSLKLTAYDGEISIEKEIKADVYEEGEICVNGKMFSDFVSKIAYFEVVVIGEDNAVTIRYDDSETKMAALPAEEFPRFAREMSKNKKHLVCKEASFKTLVSKVNFCAATDESRPILKGCLLEVREGILYATALDGFRMAYAYCNVEGSSAEMKIVCPARTLIEISRMLDSDENLKVYADKYLLSVGVKDTVITSRLYVGEFVKKENVFPLAFATKVTLKRAELISSVERASVLIRGEKDNLILLDVKNGKVVINANSDIGKIEETVSAELEGKELKVAMNSKYLLDAVKALEEEYITLSFNTAVTPFTLENVEDKTSQYLVVPLRTSNN